MSGESLHGSNTANADPSSWQSLMGPFKGETGLNSATGEARTYDQEDLYPQLEGESDEDYRARLERQRQIEDDYTAKGEEAEALAAETGVLNAKGQRTEAYLKSEYGQHELALEADYDRVVDKLQKMVDDGHMTQARANALAEREYQKVVEQIVAARHDYEGSLAQATPDDDAKYEAWQMQQRKEEYYTNATPEELRKKLADRKAEYEGLKGELEHMKPSNYGGYYSRDVLQQDQARMASENDDPKRANLQRQMAMLEREIAELEERLAAMPAETAANVADTADGAAEMNPGANDGGEAAPGGQSAETEDVGAAGAETNSSDAGTEGDQPESESTDDDAENESGYTEDEPDDTETEPDDAEEEGKFNDGVDSLADIDKLPDEALAHQREVRDLMEQLQREHEQLERPLTAVNLDFEADAREMAQMQAKEALNAETSKKGFFRRLWKGTLFRKYYEHKYTNELLNGERTMQVDGQEMTVSDAMARRRQAAVDRFVRGATEDAGFIHTAAGENYEEADAETTARVKEAVEWFAQAEIPEHGSLEDLKREFGNRIGYEQARARDEGRTANSMMFDNYMEVALQAREAAEHHMAMDRVMDGFKVYNAKVRSGVRTETHRDKLDTLIDKLEQHHLVLPAQVLAAAGGIAAALTQTGVRAVAGAGGGLVASGVISGLRERNRVTEDRAHMMRSVAIGQSFEGTADGERRSKRAKYEAAIGGTLYQLENADVLTGDIEAAMAAEGDGREEQLLQAIAAARVRTEMSDSLGKDLIAYSSADRCGDERLKLDMALIRAEHSLSDASREQLEAMKSHIRSELEEQIDSKDAAFRRKRAALAAKKAGKTMLIGAGTFVVSQEAIAALDPNKIGLFEKVGLLKTENAADASQTLLARLTGPRVVTADSVVLNETQTVERETLKANGYTEQLSKEATTETQRVVTEVAPADAANQMKVKIDGWANNGTKVSDGNELRVYGDPQRGFVSAMRGNSTMSDGSSINYDQALADGRIKGILTVGGAKFEVKPTFNADGQPVWGENGIFTTTAGDTIAAGDGYRYFQVVVDNGIDTDGVDHVVSLATSVGRDNFAGTVTQVGEMTVESPAEYILTKTVEAPLTYAGAFVPETARTGLGASSSAERPNEEQSAGDQVA